MLPRWPALGRCQPPGQAHPGGHLLAGENPTLLGRRLAIELQRRREAAGLTREEAARQLEWSTSTIFRIETGRSRPQPGNVKVLLGLYGVTGPERDGLIRLTREARQPGWWHSFKDVLPNPYEVYIGLEAGAAAIRNFEPTVVPGLLQTEDYARQMSMGGPRELDRDDIERLVQVRMERQRVLSRQDRPRLWGCPRRGGHPPCGGRPGGHARAASPPHRVRRAGQDHAAGRAFGGRRARRHDRPVRHLGLPGIG